jgi:hypothetical protein
MKDFGPRLPDGVCIFKSKIPVWEGLAMDVGIFYWHLSILRPFGIFFPFRYVLPRKIWQPCFGKDTSVGTQLDSGNSRQGRVSAFFPSSSRVARFISIQHTKTGKIYQMTIKYAQWL